MDLPETATGLARGAPTPVAMLDLEHARVGVDVPNAVKGIAVAWDPLRNEVWHAGIFSTWLIAHDPDTGLPLRAVDIDVEGFNPATLYVDSSRRRLFWVSARQEQIRVVDLDKGTLIGRIDVDSAGRSHYPTSAHALDVADGRMWVYNTNAGTLSGYDVGGGKTRSLTNVTRVFDIAAAPAGGKLALIDVPGPQNARLLVVDTAAGTATEACSFTQRPPNHVLIMDDGDMILSGQRLRRVDAACAEKWSLQLSESPDSLALGNQTVVATLATGAQHDGGFGSQVALIDLATGTLKDLVPSRFAAEKIAVDLVSDRVFVGNAGDGSISVIPLKDPAGAKILPVASSADDVVVDPTSGDAYVLSRLGGSRIWRWRQDGTVSVFADQAAWPFALEIDPKRRLLIAPSYFEARLYVWSLDDGSFQTIDLGIPGATGDSLGELGYDAKTGVAAVIMPDGGWLSVVDVGLARLRYSHHFEELSYGSKAGPGKASVAVAAGSVYVAGPVEAKVWRLAQDRDVMLAEGALPSVGGADASAGSGPRAGGPRRGGRGVAGAGSGPRGGRGHGCLDRGNVYAFNLFHYDVDGGRLFYGGQVLDPETLELGPTAGANVKLVFSSAERLVALGVANNGHGDDVLVLDPATLSITERRPALVAPTAHAEAAYDPTSRRIYLADLPRARVTVFQLDRVRPGKLNAGGQ